jgi:transposase
MTRTHARAPIGERAKVTQPFKRGSPISVLSALGVHGVYAPMMLEGALNSEVFEQYVEHWLVPCLRPGNLVWLDHVKFHYSPRAIAWIEATGAKVLPIPAYAPDLNPLEQCIAKLKETLRSFKARTKRTLSNALATALALVTEGDIRGWCEHCGYVFSLK